MSDSTEWMSGGDPDPQSKHKLALRPDGGEDTDPKAELLDDVVVTNVSCFRMEQMDKNLWWLCCYLDATGEQHDRIAINMRFNRKTGNLEAYVTEYPNGRVSYEQGSLGNESSAK